MNLTAAALITICPHLRTTGMVPAWVDALNPAMLLYNIDNKPRMAAFLAQAAHESAEFTQLVENLNYSVTGLIGTFPSRITVAEAATFARQPERIANRVYANRMGNGPEDSGDGWRFRGRGPFQLTGRANYLQCSLAVYNDDTLIQNPDRLLQPIGGALSAAWFWQSRGLNPLADDGQFTAITKKINGGTNGLAQRLAYFHIANDVLQEN